MGMGNKQSNTSDRAYAALLNQDVQGMSVTPISTNVPLSNKKSDDILFLLNGTIKTQ